MNNDNVFFDFVNFNFYPEFVYFLGLCWADGAVYNTGYHNKVSIELVSSDALVVQPTLEKMGKWKIMKRTRTHTKILGVATVPHESTIFRISNKSLIRFLIDHGYKNKNGSHTQILSVIPEKLHPLFFRGLLDGDGHISLCETSRGYNVVSIVTAGPIDQDWSGFESFCIRHSISYRINFQKQHRSSGSTFIINKKKDLLRFIRLIFSTENQFLVRKHIKAMDIVKEILKRPKYR